MAVLKIDAKDLPTVRIGSARDLALGQWVLAIGSPFGFANRVAAGVVSARQRALPGDGCVPFTLSFAIPVVLAMKNTDPIVATGHATHAKRGVTVQDFDQALAQSVRLGHADEADRVGGASPACRRTGTPGTGAASAAI